MVNTRIRVLVISSWSMLKKGSGVVQSTRMDIAVKTAVAVKSSVIFRACSIAMVSFVDCPISSFTSRWQQVAIRKALLPSRHPLKTSLGIDFARK